MPDSPEEPPKLVGGRFLMTDKPNPFARRAKMRHAKLVLILATVVIVIGLLTYMSLTFPSWAQTGPRNILD